MNEMNYEAILGDMDVAYETATARESGKLPDGRYTAILKEAVIKESPKGLRLVCSYIVTDGQYTGRMIFDSHNINKDSIDDFKAYVETLDVPLARLSALPKALPLFSGRMVAIRLVTSRANPDYQNAYVNKFIGMGDLEQYLRKPQAAQGQPDQDGFTPVDMDAQDLPFN